jgi:hypothetical protein
VTAIAVLLIITLIAAAIVLAWAVAGIFAHIQDIDE